MQSRRARNGMDINIDLEIGSELRGSQFPATEDFRLIASARAIVQGDPAEEQDQGNR